MVTHPRLMNWSLVPTLCPKLMSSILWWSVLAPKNLSVVLVCVELMSLVALCTSDQWSCVELQWLVMKMASSVICYVQWSVYFCDDDEDGKFCDLLYAMVCVLLWWIWETSDVFCEHFVMIMMLFSWWKLPCSVTKTNTLYRLPHGAKLWQHVGWWEWSTR